MSSRVATESLAMCSCLLGSGLYDGRSTFPDHAALILFSGVKQRLSGELSGCSPCISVRRSGVLTMGLPYWQCHDCRVKGTACPAPLVALDQHQRSACADLDVSTIFAARDMGTAKFEPENPAKMAKFTPITFPLALNTGPPDPPEVVCAS
jgi:hypothetical protein